MYWDYDNAYGSEKTGFWLGFPLSLLLHGGLVALLIALPHWVPISRPMMGAPGPSVIDVSMVELPAEPAPAPVQPEPVQEPAPLPEPTPPPEPAEPAVAEPVMEPPPPVAPEPVVAEEIQTINPVKEEASEEKPAPAPEPEPAPEPAPKPEKPAEPEPVVKKKTALKRKTKKEDPRLDSVQSAIERIRQKVEKGAKQQGRLARNQTGPGVPNGGNSGSGGALAARLIDFYKRGEVAPRVQGNWAFSEQLAGTRTGLEARLIFKVMPDGRIRDILFTKRSGSRYFDQSAYKAIVKSSPFPPHPPGIGESYITVGLRFTPSGIN